MNIARNAFAALLIAAGAFIAAPPLAAQLHEPSEILEILESSPISYQIDFDEETEPRKENPEQILPGYFVSKDEESPQFGQYELSEEVQEIYTQAELHFSQKRYDSAITLYRKVLQLMPEFAQGLTMIGDAYFNMEQYDSAQFYLREAIDLNFIDYQAHWFLSSTEFHLGNKEAGLRELTIAHVLNPGHELLKASLIASRKKHGSSWKEWSFAPRYELSDESIDQVSIRCASGWMMFALTQALWEFEEDYGTDMGIEDRESLEAEVIRQKEAVLMFIFEYLARKEADTSEEEGEEEVTEETKRNTEAADRMGTRLVEILNEGMIDAFIFYEIIGRRNPLVFSMISPESVDMIAGYLDNYH